MPRFFRQIRQRFLTDKKFSKYLLYAVGEILLVVIGILIALQVDTWQDANQKRNREIEFLSQMKETLNLEISDLQFNIEALEGSLKSIRVVQKHLEDQLPYHDSLAYHFANSSREMGYMVRAGVYEQLKSSGMDLISNDSLRNQIVTHYDVNTYFLVDLENILVHNHNNISVRPMMMRKFNYSWFTKPAIPNDYRELLKDSEYLSLLKTTWGIIHFQLSRTRSVLESGQRLQESIEKELVQLRS